MKPATLLVTLVTALAIASSAILSMPVNAESQQKGILTSQHIKVIKDNCRQAQSIMTQLHKSDQLLRVNQGQIYESISTKLMAPFNARAGLNQYDTTELVTITNRYNNHLNEYRTLYKDYDLSIQKSLKIDCRNQPVAFYDSVADARENRTEIHDKIGQIVKDIDAYEKGFNKLIKEGPLVNAEWSTQAR